MAAYRFLTTWLIEAERLADGDAAGIGQVGRYLWRSRIPYPVRFEITTTRVERPHLLEGRAVGELEGTGLWRLFEQDGVTAVIYDWNVATTRAWMNVLAPIARPIFRRNHDWVMQSGAAGIAGLLGARLLAAD